MSPKSHSAEERTELVELLKILHLLGKNHISEGSLEMDSQWVCRVSVQA